MIKKIVSKCKTRKVIQNILTLAMILATAAACTVVSAYAEPTVSTVMTQVEKIIKVIGCIIGVLMIAIGGIKLGMAQSDGSGPDQKNAIGFIAAGAGVIVFCLAILSSLMSMITEF